MKATTSTDLTNPPQEGMIHPKQGASQKSLPKMARKPVIKKDAKTVLISRDAAFEDKILCNSIILDLGDAVVMGCSFCYVESEDWKSLSADLTGHKSHGGRRPTEKSPRHFL